MGQFLVGDKVVYPAHGVAEVVAIEQRSISGANQEFYLLRILENNMRVMVPVSNASQVGMRGIVGTDEADLVFKELGRKEKVTDSAPWNRRHREYMTKIKTGSIFEVAKVLKDLYILKGDKELSFGERKMLDTAKTLLVTEISLSKGMTHEEIESQFRSIFRC